MNSQQNEVASLMEQKARNFPLLSRATALRLETKDKDETLKELAQLHQLLRVLSEELRASREVVSGKEKQFSLLANYKNLLERTLVLPRLVTRVKKKSRESELLERLEALTPEQLAKLEDIEL